MPCEAKGVRQDSRITLLRFTLPFSFAPSLSPPSRAPPHPWSSHRKLSQGLSKTFQDHSWVGNPFGLRPGQDKMSCLRSNRPTAPRLFLGYDIFSYTLSMFKLNRTRRVAYSTSRLVDQNLEDHTPIESIYSFL